MKKLRHIALAASLLAGSLLSISISSAEAKPYKKRVNVRQGCQQKRLTQGAASGSLTGKEYLRLQKQQAHLAKKEFQYRQSGDGLTRKEAAKLEVMQDRVSGNIYKQKHDGQTR